MPANEREHSAIEWKKTHHDKSFRLYKCGYNKASYIAHFRTVKKGTIAEVKGLVLTINFPVEMQIPFISEDMDRTLGA